MADGERTESVEQDDNKAEKKTAFDEAFDIFYEDLKKKKKKKWEFVNRISENGQSPPEKVKESVEQLIKKPPQNKVSRKVHNGLRSVAETLRDYGGVVDTMIQAYPYPTALIWGGLKIVLEVELIADAIQKLPDILLDLLSFENLYDKSICRYDAVQRILSASYKVILLFWYRSTKIMEHPKVYALTGRGDRKLAKLVKDLEDNRDSLIQVRDTIETELNHHMRTDLEEARRQMLEEQTRAELHRARQVSELNWQKMIKSFGESADISSTTYENAQIDRHRGTCRWLFSHEAYIRWTRVSDSQSPILWLNGKHGAGKTVLCAAAIDHVKQTLQSQSGPCLPNVPSVKPFVAFHFFTKDEYVSRKQILGSISNQLLVQAKKAAKVAATSADDYDTYSVFPKSLERFLDMNGDRSADVEDLIRALLQEMSPVYIFLDGLDETEYTDDQLRPATARHDDVEAVVRFLATETISTTSSSCQSSSSSPSSLPRSKIRLWCSSQPLPQLLQLMCGPDRPWKDSVGQLNLQPHHTASDIMEYIASSISESTEDKGVFARMFAMAGVASEAEGNFLWTRTILDELKLETEDDEELFHLVRGGLPNKMSDIYQRVIERIKARQPRSYSRLGSPPLWKIILSLVTFSKRPLHMTEVIEAVAIFRTVGEGNLNTSKVTTADRILNCCLSLVRLGSAAENESSTSNPVLRLSHSAVRAFLLEHADVSLSSSEGGEEREEYVTRTIIQDCCFRYLRQPRYRSPLVLDPVDPTVFRTCMGDKVASCHLLSYAAKYWFQHFYESDVTSRDGQRAMAFLRSPHFQTCIQVQCLFVVGHFLQRFDPVTDQCLTVRRTLPTCIVEDKSIWLQYVAFQSEWCHLLQAIQNRQLGGQVDRCFWAALGPSNFLSQNVSRYKSFPICSADDTSGSKVCQMLQVAPSGECFTLCSIQDNGDTKTLHVETWSIDRVDKPQRQGTFKVAFCPSQTNIERYWLPCSQESLRQMPFLPDVRCITPPPAIRLDCAQTDALRIGSQIFMKQSPPSADGPVPVQFDHLENKAIGTSWEEIAVRGPYMVVCRRRVPRPQQPISKRRSEMDRVRFMQDRQRNFPAYFRSRSRRRSTGRRRLDVAGDGFLGSVQSIISALSASSGSDDDTNSSICSPQESDENDDQLDPSALESWSEGSTSPDDSSSDEDSLVSGEGNDNGHDDDDDHSTLDDISQSSESDSENSNSDIASSLSINDASDEDSEAGSIASQLSLVRVGNDSDSDSSNSDSTSSNEKKNEQGEGQEDGEAGSAVRIRTEPRRVFCDGCYRGPLRTFYRCVKCSSSNTGTFDLCRPCETRGRWCMNQGHQLCKIDSSSVVGMVSRSNFRIRQELKVVLREETAARVVFHTKKKYNSLLYQSPPIIHPNHPLVVWPMTGTKLLFANFCTNTFFEQKIQTPGKGQTICVSLSFSHCGHYLRVASVDVPNTAKSGRPHKSQRSQQSSRAKAGDDLRLNLWVLRLSGSNPVKNVPKLVTSACFDLGPASLRVVQNTPFTFTWTLTELYVTVSSLQLSVYRIDLPADGAGPGAPGPCLPPEQGRAGQDTSATPATTPTMTTPREAIYLPRSSRHRSVQFFPPRKPGDCAMIFIGPRFGKRQESPIVVYLSDKDLGDWEDALNTGDVSHKGRVARPKLEGQLEEFVENQDCDLISLQ